MLKRISPEVIGGWIDSRTHYVGGELETLKAQVDAQQKVLCEILRQLTPYQQLSVYARLNGSVESYTYTTEGYVTYTASEEAPE